MSSISRETIRWAYRLFLDREPENESVLDSHFPNMQALRDSFLGSTEYRIKNNAGDFNRESWVIGETVYGFRIWVSLAELGVSRPIIHDSYDNRETQFVKTIVGRGDTAFDIGANIGYYALLMATLAGPTGHVFGFEPLSYLYQFACKSVIENDYQDFCKIQNLALSNVSGTLKIRHAPITTNFGGGHIAPNGNPPKDHVDPNAADASGEFSIARFGPSCGATKWCARTSGPHTSDARTRRR